MRWLCKDAKMPQGCCKLEIGQRWGMEDEALLALTKQHSGRGVCLAARARLDTSVVTNVLTCMNA